MADDARVSRLEAEVRALRSEMKDLREQVRALNEWKRGFITVNVGAYPVEVSPSTYTKREPYGNR
jgi:hypothetical protein